jgi:hypothetical protein
MTMRAGILFGPICNEQWNVIEISLDLSVPWQERSLHLRHHLCPDPDASEDLEAEPLDAWRMKHT